MIRIIPITLAALISSAATAQVEITDSQRYLDSSTYVLNEPCIEFNGTQFMGQFVLETEGGYVWKVLSGEELTESRTGCTAITAGSNENEIFFNLSNLVIADGNADTGQRYDVDSVADATRLDLGFAITNAVASAPALVNASNLELPLYFTNQTYGEGLEVCLSTIGADSITISNENNSVELLLSEELESGIKSFCGTIAQEDLEFGDVFYDAQLGEQIIENAITYWNPECDSVNANLCNSSADLDPVAVRNGVTVGREFDLRMIPVLFDSKNSALVNIYNALTDELLDTLILEQQGEEYSFTYTATSTSVYIENYFENENGRRGLITKRITLNSE